VGGYNSGVSSLTGEWIDRPVLVMFSSSSDDEDYQTMLNRLHHQRGELDRRRVMVITVAGMRVAINGESTTAFTPSELRRMLELQSHGFALILLGDDGSERLRRFEPMTVDELLKVLNEPTY
jgi:hypothetical protein